MENRLRRIIIAAIIFVAALIVNVNLLKITLFLISYLIVGYDIIKEAFENIFRGQVLDENFLMSIASIGAFLIGEYP